MLCFVAASALACGKRGGERRDLQAQAALREAGRQQLSWLRAILAAERDAVRAPPNECPLEHDGPSPFLVNFETLARSAGVDDRAEARGRVTFAPSDELVSTSPRLVRIADQLVARRAAVPDGFWSWDIVVVYETRPPRASEGFVLLDFGALEPNDALKGRVYVFDYAHAAVVGACAFDARTAWRR